MRLLDPECVEVIIEKADFDYACNEAFSRAEIQFGIDMSGDSIKFEFFDKSTDSVLVKFETYTRKRIRAGEFEHIYQFTAWMDRVKS